MLCGELRWSRGLKLTQMVGKLPFLTLREELGLCRYAELNASQYRTDISAG